MFNVIKIDKDYALAGHYDNSSFPQGSSHVETYLGEDIGFYRNATGFLTVRGQVLNNATVVAFGASRGIKAMVVDSLIAPPEPLLETIETLNLTYTRKLLNISNLPKEYLELSNYTM